MIPFKGGIEEIGPHPGNDRDERVGSYTFDLVGRDENKAIVGIIGFWFPFG